MGDQGSGGDQVSEERLYNTSVVFDRAGAELARYSKMHLWDAKTPDGVEYRESDAITAGNEVVVCDLEGVIAGLAICYDVRFPQLFHALTDRGAQVLLVPAAFSDPHGDQPLGASSTCARYRERLLCGCLRAVGRLHSGSAELRAQHGGRSLGSGRRSVSRGGGYAGRGAGHGASASRCGSACQYNGIGVETYSGRATRPDAPPLQLRTKACATLPQRCVGPRGRTGIDPNRASRTALELPGCLTSRLRASPALAVRHRVPGVSPPGLGLHPPRRTASAPGPPRLPASVSTRLAVRHRGSCVHVSGG